MPEAHLHRGFFASTAKPASASGNLEFSQIAERNKNYLKLVGSPLMTAAGTHLDGVLKLVGNALPALARRLGRPGEVDH